MNDHQNYDVFVSYSRADDETNGFIGKLAQTMRMTFRSHTGRSLRIFLDTNEIATAQVWEDRILTALERSSLLLAVLSPSYFTSTWCAREWDYFRILEDERTAGVGALEYQKLIFPVLSQKLDRILRPSDETRRRIQETQKRQHLDFSNTPPDHQQFEMLAAKLVDDMIDVLIQIEGQLSGVMTSPPDKDEPSARPRETELIRRLPGIVMRYGQDREQFVQLLSEATHVTIIGITNDNLAEFLEEALEQKRRRLGSHAFWESIRVVFLSDKLLPLVNDELVSHFPSREEATQRRAQKAGLGKRSVASFLIRSNHPTKWTLYEYPYIPPFTGALFTTSDGGRSVQIAQARPRRSTWEHMFFQFNDFDQYFEWAFQEVIDNSIEQNEIILVGAPVDSGKYFQCYSARFRRGVMIDGENLTDWLPAIIVVTWWKDNRTPVPLLQVNTLSNSTREIGKVSHVSGYINQRDHMNLQPRVARDAISIFDMPITAAESAVRRELREELQFGEQHCQLRLYDKLAFYYPDKENLYFFLFDVELPRSMKFPPHAEIYPWSVDDLIQIRDHQVLCNLISFTERDSLSPTQMEIASRILALNLTLHGKESLGKILIEEVQHPNGGLAGLHTEVARLIAKTKYSHYSSGRELRVSGLAGLQYRELFSSIIPLYASLGVPKARERLDEIANDTARSKALEELKELYHNEGTMMALPIEV